MKNFLVALLMLSLLFNLSACSSTPSHENKAVGAVAGGAIGGTIAATTAQGAETTALISTGVIIGALIGSVYGNPMDNSDKEKAYKAIATGKSSAWKNPGTKASYTITPCLNYVTIEGNPYCRPFVATQTTVEGHTRKISQAACRKANGTWELAH